MFLSQHPEPSLSMTAYCWVHEQQTKPGYFFKLVCVSKVSTFLFAFCRIYQQHQPLLHLTILELQRMRDLPSDSKQKNMDGDLPQPVSKKARKLSSRIEKNEYVSPTKSVDKKNSVRMTHLKRAYHFSRSSVSRVLNRGFVPAPQLTTSFMHQRKRK